MAQLPGISYYMLTFDRMFASYVQICQGSTGNIGKADLTSSV